MPSAIALTSLWAAKDGIHPSFPSMHLQLALNLHCDHHQLQVVSLSTLMLPTQGRNNNGQLGRGKGLSNQQVL
jgi:hypothetical protein